MEFSVELDTEVKLAILQSIFEHVDQERLLETLLSCDGDVQKSTTQLSNSKRPRQDSATIASGSSVQKLRWSSTADLPKRKNEAVLELQTAAQIETTLPCTLITNVLETNLARRLLLKMLEESQNWKQGYFKLFDRTVTSPHVAGFYLESTEEISRHDAYVYNGQAIQNIRLFTPEMSEAHRLVEQRTQEWLKARNDKLGGAIYSSWCSNVAFSNLYDGRKSAVGYHSDQLTYLGPLATIASLSLGCEREFRLKPVVSSGTARTVSVRLPHNSLFIMGPGKFNEDSTASDRLMHLGCQEDYKHSIHPVGATKGLDLHPLAGARRINITYRNYRPDYAPTLLPRCQCGQAVLRSAKPFTGDGKSHEQGARPWHGRRYFWHCDGDKNPGSEGCGYFKWATFTTDGAPVLT